MEWAILQVSVQCLLETGDSSYLGFFILPFKILGEKNLIDPTWVPLRSLELSLSLLLLLLVVSLCSESRSQRYKVLLHIHDPAPEPLIS